jgi:metallo-beta-lactamase family protein
VDGARKVRIFGDEFAVNAQVALVDGFSAHADRSELLDWLAPTLDSLKGIFIVHGEPTGSLAFAEAIRARRAHLAINVPELGQSFEI